MTCSTSEQQTGERTENYSSMRTIILVALLLNYRCCPRNNIVVHASLQELCAAQTVCVRQNVISWYYFEYDTMYNTAIRGGDYGWPCLHGPKLLRTSGLLLYVLDIIYPYIFPNNFYLQLYIEAVHKRQKIGYVYKSRRASVTVAPAGGLTWSYVVCAEKPQSWLHSSTTGDKTFYYSRRTLQYFELRRGQLADC